MLEYRKAVTDSANWELHLGDFAWFNGQLSCPLHFRPEAVRHAERWNRPTDETLDAHASSWGCSRHLAALILLQLQYADWYASQRFADGFQRGQELAAEGVFTISQNSPND